MLKLLIADDNLELAKNIFNKIIESNIKIKTVNISVDGKEVIEYLLKEHVDILLLDLQMPGTNGVNVLNKLNSINYNTKIIIITGDIQLLSLSLKGNYIIDKIFMKPFVIDDLISYLKLIYNNTNREIYKKQIYKNITKILDKFNFNKSSLGYKYLIDSIYVCVENNRIIIPMEKELYKIVASKNNVENFKNIKWIIEKSILKMNQETDKNILYSHFNNAYPTPKSFIIEVYNEVIRSF